jgi:hypothetical protein
VCVCSHKIPWKNSFLKISSESVVMEMFSWIQSRLYLWRESHGILMVSLSLTALVRAVDMSPSALSVWSYTIPLIFK